jgi:hypothetical protein
VVRTPNSRDTLLTAAWEGLASGYDASTVAELAAATGIARPRSATTSRPRLAAVRLVRGRQPSRLSRGRRRSRAGWPRFTRRFGYTDVSADDAKRPAKRSNAVVRRRISICQLAPELG